MSICGDAGRRADEVRRRDRRHLHRHARVQLDPRGARRRGTAPGKGQHVEVSLFDSGLAMLATSRRTTSCPGSDARRFGNGHPNIVPYTAYPSADGMIARRGRQRRAVRAVRGAARQAGMGGRPALRDEPRARREPRDAGRGDRGGAAARQTADLDREARAPPACRAGRINSVAQALSDPHTLARDMVRTVAASDRGRSEDAGHPVPLQRHAGFGAPRAADARAAHRAGAARGARGSPTRASPSCARRKSI